MVKLYLNSEDEIIVDNKGKYFDINLWSFIKIHLMALAIVVGTVYGLSFIFGFFSYLTF
jgi:hypothetical protein